MPVSVEGVGIPELVAGRRKGSNKAKFSLRIRVEQRFSSRPYAKFFGVGDFLRIKNENND